MGPFVLAVLLLTGLQDPPKLTLEKSGTFRDLVEEVSKKFGETVKVDPAVENKTIEVRVTDAGFYQAVDALCRAHGGVSYLDEDYKTRGRPELNLRSGTWVEYPASYWGNYKVMVVSWTRLKSKTDVGERSWVRGNLNVFYPPSLSVDSADAWQVTEALEGEGRDVRSVKGEPEPTELVRIDSTSGFNHALIGKVHFRDFDLQKGLRKLEGTTVLDAARRVQVRVPLEVGSKTEIPQGEILVKSIQEIKSAGGPLWAVGLKIEARDAENRRFGDRFDPWIRFDDGDEQYERVSLGIASDVEIKTEDAGPRPKALFLRARADPVKVSVPFSFKDVFFKVD